VVLVDGGLGTREGATENIASRGICLRAGDRAKILGKVADNPRVSVCLPAYNAEPYIEATLDSVLGQTEHDIEVIVVDDRSSDATLALIRARDDERLQVHANERNLGAVPTVNHAMALSRGRYLKIVHSDDSLEEDCLEKMADALDRHPSAGLVFAPRRVVLEEGSGRAAMWWANANRELHRGFGELAECNSGGELFDRWLRQGLQSNWIGEPTGVMLRRSTLERVGLISPRVVGYHDGDMWARVLRVADAVFLDEPLTTFRTGGPSLSSALRATNADWLERLWVYEGLLADGLEGWRREWMLAMRRNERLEVAKDTVRMGARGRAGAELVLRDLAAYAGYRLRARIGRAPSLRPSLPAV
jgi:glycosyltransferase involved in cell wall biosynthesis